MLLRRARTGGLEVYLTRRHARSRFMPDAFVFPGGALDPDDHVVARTRVRGTTGDAAPELVVAAVRETFEEAGVLLASSAADALPVALGPQSLADLRNELTAGTLFSTLLVRHDLFVDAERLAYYSNWITPEAEPIRFDAHFFVARAPHDQTAAADAIEVHDGVWLTPADALALGKDGSMTVRFPTQKHLERLAAHPDSEDVVERFFYAARARSVEPVRPAMSTRNQSGREEILLDDHAW